VEQGHDVARVVVLCVIVAVVLRALLLIADARLDRITLPERARRPVQGGAWAAAAIAILLVVVAFDVPGEVRDRYDQFLNDASPNTEVTRGRLGSASNAGRIAFWEAAVKGFEENRLAGTGAGTYRHLWLQYRPAASANSHGVDAHGLYAEVLGELGVVGLMLLLVAIGALVVGLAPFRRKHDRAVYGALFAATLATAIHSGFDWDWEMPATTLWMFALGGLALGRARRSPGPGPLRGIGLAAVGLLALALIVVSGVVLASQTRLDASMEAFQDGECRGALTEARAARDALPQRPEPHEMVGVCLARAGRYAAAASALGRALDRDPRNSRLHYSRAAVLAAMGRDPRPELRLAQRLNPYLKNDVEGLEELGTGGRAARRRTGRALAATLPLSGRW
jgi:hypothetical protein